MRITARFSYLPLMYVTISAFAAPLIVWIVWNFKFIEFVKYHIFNNLESPALYRFMAKIKSMVCTSKAQCYFDQ